MAKPAARIIFIEALLAIGGAAILARSFTLQVVQHRQWEALAKAQRSASKPVPARRGRIFDRYGEVLAISQEHYRLSVALNEVKDTAGLETALVKSLGLPRAKVEKEFQNEYPYFHGPFSAEQVAPIRKIHGITTETLYDRVYPKQALAAPLLGRLNEAGRTASRASRSRSTRCSPAHPGWLGISATPRGICSTFRARHSWSRCRVGTSISRSIMRCRASPRAC